MAVVDWPTMTDCRQFVWTSISNDSNEIGWVTNPTHTVQISKVFYHRWVNPSIHSSSLLVIPDLIWQITTEFTRWLYGCIITNRSASPPAISVLTFINFGQISTRNASSFAKEQLSATLPGIINFAGSARYEPQAMRRAAYAWPDLKWYPSFASALSRQEMLDTPHHTPPVPRQQLLQRTGTEGILHEPLMYGTFQMIVQSLDDGCRCYGQALSRRSLVRESRRYKSNSEAKGRSL